MELLTRDEMESALRTVYEAMAPTPQYAWPLLGQRLGARVWVKHENHTPVGAFKVRGGLVYLQGLRRREPAVTGIVSATRGNHGQSLALAGRRHGLLTTIVVPQGNSVEKNAAMRALGAELVEHGSDFQAAREHAAGLAQQHGWHCVPSFHRDLVRGVSTAWVEFFQAVQPDVVFVPVGLGSGIVACAMARAYTGVSCRLIGVVSAHATAYHDSFQAQRVMEAPVSTVLADGMACRVPDADALAVMLREVDEVITVTDAEVATAMRALFSDTHNAAEGAGAASLAGALQQRQRWRGRCVGLMLSGGNVDRSLMAQVLAGTDSA